MTSELSSENAAAYPGRASRTLTGETSTFSRLNRYETSYSRESATFKARRGDKRADRQAAGLRKAELNQS